MMGDLDDTWPEDVDGARNLPTKKIYETLMRTGMQWGILCGRCNDSEGRKNGFITAVGKYDSRLLHNRQSSKLQAFKDH